DRDRGCHKLHRKSFSERKRLRSGQLTRCNFPTRLMDRDRNQTTLLFKSYSERRLDLAQLAGAGEHECSPNVGVSGKRNFSRRGEDSDAARVTSLCRKYKRGLREIELARDLLHLLRREPNRLRQHGQLISTEARLG